MKLSDEMEFDHVIEVHEDGSVTSVADIYAPELYNGVLSGEGWTLMTGYSGQDRYSGPIMHNSELIGGKLEEDILSTPGIYVSLVCYWDNDETYDGEGDSELVVEGWAIARKDMES